MKNKSLFLPIFLFTINLLAIIYFWHSGSPINTETSLISNLISLGRLSGLLLAYFLLIQLILIGRLKMIEGVLGHDRLSKLHRNVGISITVFLLAHPILLAVGYGLNNEISWFKQLYNFIFKFDDLSGATFATIGLILVILLSAGIIGRRWKYERWYLSHLFAYFAIFMAFGHQIELGGDFSQFAFVIYWYALFVILLIAFAYSRFLIPLNNFRRFKFKVLRVVEESADIYSIFIGGQNLEHFIFSGGQFAIFRFLSKNLWYEAHPFSFSSCLKNNEIRISIKKLGDFTTRLPQALAIGTPVLIDGPLGVFTARETAKKYLLISGGIGITPIRALTEELVNKKLDTKIFYSAGCQAEEVFSEEMKKLTVEGNFQYYRFFSRDSSLSSDQNIFAGRISLEKISSLIPDWREREIYFCGPVKMCQALNQEFLKAGVSKKKIHWERFSF